MKENGTRRTEFLLPLLGLLLAVAVGCGSPAPTPVPAPTVTLAPPAVTLTPTGTPTPAPTRSPEPSDTAGPTLTFTASPTAPPTQTPSLTPTPSPNAQVAAGRGGLRLRASPGEDGAILNSLDEFTPLIVLGRTADNVWLRVVTPGQESGWVMARFVELRVQPDLIPVIDIQGVPVGEGGRPLQTPFTTILTALPATFTPPAPAVPVQPTAVAAAPRPDARVAAGRGGLRLRASPGTAGEEQVRLAELTPLNVIGRTADNTWMQVITPEGNTGWVWSAYVDVYIDLGVIPITGEAVDAPPVVEAPPPPPAVRLPGNVVSGITSHARQIFQRGQQLGNRANVFSKVGDSITYATYFLYPIGWGQYDLGSYANLAPVIQHFAAETAREGNSFANRSMAAYGGWTTESMFTPGLKPEGMPPGICQPGELPLVCEYRVVRPAVALIMLGTNDITYMPLELYRANLTRVVEVSIEMGVIPVLSTIPPRADRDVQPFNQTVVGIARAYDIPLWDYYSAMVALPDSGLSPDGVHPSAPPGDFSASTTFTPQNLRYGYTVRNLTALQVLDAIWRQVLY